jgi:carboxyl-terminal processing protease
MKNKILIPALILGALAAFFSFKLIDDKDGSNEEKRKLVIETVTKAINQGHFAPRKIDDSFSAKVYDKLITQVDYEKKFFTQQDIDELKKYEFRIDDEIKSGSINFFNIFNTLFTKRLNNAEEYYKDLLKAPFAFNTDEKIELKGEKIAYAASEAELKDRWRKYLKYRVLQKYVDLKNDQDKKKANKDSTLAKLKTDAELEVEARNSIQKNMENYYKRMRKMTEDDRFTLYVNSITGTHDPHTDYFPPRDKQRFDEAMSGTFFGIGAQLQQTDEGKIKIVSIIPGSPCWKQGQLKAGDEIMKVGQAGDEPVDIQGFETEDAVQLIRGKKGTEVRLTVKKPNGAIQIIPIVRGEVPLDETFAKSIVIDDKNGQVGYIYLPEFYADFQHINGRRCAEDVALEIMKLKNEGVKGIILDLRWNSGGSLSDVVDMSGLFINEGPIVQVRTANAAPMALADRQQGVLYDGPLAIMVNEGSASASEILAAAMQDYKRAIVVGGSTYGKGTVQQVRSLDEYVNWAERLKEKIADNSDASVAGPIGSLKLTIQKFYRVNGGSTQLKGVTPDIIFPDSYEFTHQGERRDKSALKWDEIPAASYAPANAVNVAALVELSKKRMAANETFGLIKQNALRIKKQEEDNTYSLMETEYRKELDEVNATSKKMEELEKKSTPLNFINPKENLAKINMDSTNIKKNEDWIKNLKKDIYIAETVNIVNDMARMNMKVTMSDKR